jgi:hypothetical protein
MIPLSGQLIVICQPCGSDTELFGFLRHSDRERRRLLSLMTLALKNLAYRLRIGGLLP